MEENGVILESTVPSGNLLSIKFDLLSDKEMEKISVVLVDGINDVIDPKLGVPNSMGKCSTCGTSDTKYCDGHSGVLRLAAAIYHPYLVHEIVRILNKICPGCKRIKHKPQNKGSSNGTTCIPSTKEEAIEVEEVLKIPVGLKRSLKSRKCRAPIRINPNRISKGSVNYSDRKIKLMKRLITSAEKGNSEKFANFQTRNCKYCSRLVDSDRWYPRVKFKVSSKTQIVVEVDKKLPKKFQGRSLSSVLPRDFWDFIPKDPQENYEITTDKIILLPYQAFHLLKELDQKFIEKYVPKRDSLFLSSFPVISNSHRIVETMHACSDGPRLMFDDRTNAYKRLVSFKRFMEDDREACKSQGSYKWMVAGSDPHPLIGDGLVTCIGSNLVHGCLNKSKIRIQKSSGTDISAFNSGLNWIKEVVLGKRTDSAFRITVVGDPKIELGEIGIPCDISEELLISEHVNLVNKKIMKRYCDQILYKKSKFYIRRKGDLVPLPRAHDLKVGDVLSRHLKDGDIILVNRPPSIHQHSLIAFTVKILPIKSVISINPLCCAPLLADFDGDCLHGFIPQSVNCRIELGELLTLNQQLVNGQDGRHLISLSHDSLTAALLVTESETFLDRFEIQQLQMLCSHLPKYPAIIKMPFQTPLWTGKQFFSMLLPEDLDYIFPQNEVLVAKGEMLYSSGYSDWLRSSTESIFYNICKKIPSRALNYLFGAQDALCEWMSTRGLSVSLSDIYLSSDSYSRMKMIDEVKCGLEEAERLSHIKPSMVESGINNQVSIGAFREVCRGLQNVIRVHANKKNSILAMIDAGSKGSLVKLLQLSVCLGLQNLEGFSSFRIPYKLSCGPWNQLKVSDLPPEAQDILELARGNTCYAMVGSSFLNGLNPLECFVHVLSGRQNSFTDNADIPGTLARKLMFYLRDLCIAYDGTVRSSYGDQLVQFSYGFCEDSSMDNDMLRDAFSKESFEDKGIAGQPVGGMAASAISEAAYSALDLQTISSRSSPLLKLKNTLECARKKNNMDQTASLFLSKKLKRWPYGFEYGAMEVRNHLERVFFSDIVTTVMIVFSKENISGTYFSPWVSHFHLCKERMNQRGLTVGFLVDALAREYHSCSPILPNLKILCRDCSLSDTGYEACGTYCITVEAEISEDGQPQLKTIEDNLIPILLRTVVRGFVEFKKVDILWGRSSKFLTGSSGELYLKVTMSENCVPGKLWGFLLVACDPLADIIDWERSHPDRIHDVFDTFGVDTAWNFFLDNLNSTISDTGRTIHEKHLVIVADCLSVTGEFHGLNAKGLKRLQKQRSISSPFIQAYFSNPRDCFVRAAKEGAVDDLLGTVDASSWGKEVPIGTGGSFDLLYTHSVQDLDKTESAYGALLCQPQSTPDGTFRHESGHCLKVIMEKCYGDWQEMKHSNANEKIFAGRSFKPVYADADSGLKGYTTVDCKSHSVLRNFEAWDDIMAMCDSLQNILHKYSINDCLGEVDYDIVMNALSFHPQRNAKLGIGPQEIKIGYNPSFPNSRCFILVRKDGSSEDFSYRKCVLGRAKKGSPGLSIEFQNRFGKGRC